MEARRAELQGKKKSEQRMAAAAAGIDEDDWDGTVDSIVAAEFRTGGEQAYLTRAAYGVEGRDPAMPLNAAALVIGIQNYEGTRELKNTLSDAKAVAEKFEGMGFDVMSLTDENAEDGKVDQDQMLDIIDAFMDKVDENTIAAFAYMGASQTKGLSRPAPWELVSRLSVRAGGQQSSAALSLFVSSLQGTARSRRTTTAKRSTT
eukprot:COSAG06_NODE_2897_length_6120_cov_56.864308_4_plen_204_part_00